MNRFQRVELNVSALAGDVDISALLDSAGDLQIVCEHLKSDLPFSLEFRHYIAYRKLSMSHAYLAIERKQQWDDVTWLFYKSTDSDFVEWLVAQDGGVSPSLDSIHYCLFSADYVIDVLTTNPPQFTLLKN